MRKMSKQRKMQEKIKNNKKEARKEKPLSEAEESVSISQQVDFSKLEAHAPCP